MQQLKEEIAFAENQSWVPNTRAAPGHLALSLAFEDTTLSRVPLTTRVRVPGPIQWKERTDS